MAVATARIAVLTGESIPATRFRLLSAIRVAILLLFVANLGRVPVLSTGDREAPLLLNDLCVMFIAGLGLLSAMAARSFRLDRVSLLALLFAAVGAYSAVLAVPRYGLDGRQLFISLAYLARWLVYFSVYTVVINIVRAEDASLLWLSLEQAIVAIAAFGLLQAMFIPHFAQVVYPESRVAVDFDEQGNRLVSTILEPNMAGAMIMLVLLVQLARFARGVHVPTWKPVLLFAALVATLSRSSMLALLTGSLIILLIRGVSRRVLRGMGALAVLLVAASPKIIAFAASYNKLKIDASALTRVTSWIRAFRILSDHPLMGIGFNTYGFVQESYGMVRMGNGTYSLDGGLLFITVMTGFIGVGIFIAMLAVVVRRCAAVWRNEDAPDEWQALAIGIAAGTVALCVHSIFVNSLLTPLVMEPLFLMWAISFLMARALAKPPLPVGATVRVACLTPV